jgi:hypothetical protein
MLGKYSTIPLIYTALPFIKELLGVVLAEVSLDGGISGDQDLFLASFKSWGEKTSEEVCLWGIQ